MTIEQLREAWDYAIAALCLYREASGEPKEGKHAVWCVLRNRVADPRWPNTLAEVVLQPLQFSSFNRQDPNSSRIPPVISASWQECLEVIAADAPDSTDGSTNYHADYMVPFPAWASKLTQTIHVGRHIFYR